MSLLFEVSKRDKSRRPGLFSSGPTIVTRSLVPSSSVKHFPVGPSEVYHSYATGAETTVSLKLPMVFAIALFSPFVSLSPTHHQSFFRILLSNSLPNNAVRPREVYFS